MASRFTTFWLGHAQKSILGYSIIVFHLSFFSFFSPFAAVIDLLLGSRAIKKISKNSSSRLAVSTME